MGSAMRAAAYLLTAAAAGQLAAAPGESLPLAAVSAAMDSGASGTAGKSRSVCPWLPQHRSPARCKPVPHDE